MSIQRREQINVRSHDIDKSVVYQIFEQETCGIYMYLLYQI